MNDQTPIKYSDAKAKLDKLNNPDETESGNTNDVYKDLPLWEKQPEETDKAYHAFRLFRNMPVQERTQRAVCRALGLSDMGVAYWSKKHNWKERARAWDKYQHQMVAQDAAAIIVNPRAELVRDLLMDYSTLILEWRNKLQAHISDPDKFSVKELKMLVDVRDTLDQMGRRGAGMPTNYSVNAVQPDDEDNKHKGPKEISWGDPERSSPNIIRGEARNLLESGEPDDVDSFLEEEQYEEEDNG